MAEERLGKKGLIFVISGPSGSGKTTLAKSVLEAPELKDKFSRSISFTTRPKRPGEREGRDYFFISEPQFQEKLRKKKILEWTRYLGYYYATAKDVVDKKIKQGRHIILCLDLRGARLIKQLYPKNSITIFVLPPSLAALKQRIQKRCRKTDAAELKERLKLARRELLASEDYDYRLFNKDLKQAAKELRSIILSKVRRA